MLNNLMSKVMGSSLTKNYEVDKEPYMHGGLHNLWKVYRAKKKDRNNMDCSLFIFEKKTLEKKKLSQTQRDEICNILKKDPQNLTKLRHPNLLSLIEQPQEDQKYIVFATEPIEYNLSSLVFDATKKELIPGDLEIKCLCLELLEALNFLHSTAKNMHMGLAPEHLYITKDGKLNQEDQTLQFNFYFQNYDFAQQFSTSDALHVPLNFDLKINDLAVVPNMRFAAPELSDKQMCSFNTDLFSVGCLIYFMLALNKGRDPFLLNQKDITDKNSHSFEIKAFERKFPNLMAGVEADFEMLMKQLCNVNNPEARGPLNEIVNKSWFQDPLLKTIKYLETLDSKDHQNKVQFLTGITLILQKFDKKALLKKVVPLLLDQMKEIQLSVNVLPSLLDVMERPNYLTTTEFREYIWPSLQKLCKAKELPAQSLYLILKNTELFMKLVGPQEFQQNFQLLINKSLECKVPKLQLLALSKVPMMIKQLDYQVVKSQIIPRVLMILELPSQIQLKQKTLDKIMLFIQLLEIIPGIDAQTMKDKILKTFEKVRATENDPQVCMLMLKIYEQMAKTLGVEEIGLKILPGIIPMLISGTFTRVQFTDMMASVRRLLDQIEKHKEKDLRDMGQELPSQDKQDVEEKSKKQASLANPTNKDVFDFLGSLDGGNPFGNPQRSSLTNTPAASSQNIQSSLMAGFSGLNIGSQQQPTGNNNDPFSEILGGQTQTQKPVVISGGWDSEIPIISDIKPQSNNNSDNFFNSISSQSKQPVQDNSWATFNQQQPQNSTFGNKQPFQSSTTQPTNNFGANNFSNGFGQNQAMNFGTSFGVGSLAGKNDDPFADLINDSASANNLASGSSLQFNQPINQMPVGGGMGFNNKNNLNTIGNQQQNQNNAMNFGNTFGTGGQQQNTNLNNNYGTNNNTSTFNQGGGFGNMGLGLEQNTFAQQNMQGFFYSFILVSLMLDFKPHFKNNLLGGLNFGNNPSQNQQISGGLNFNTNLGFGSTNLSGGMQQNKPLANNNMSGLNDDFFSQFTTGQQKPQNNNGFNF